MPATPRKLSKTIWLAAALFATPAWCQSPSSAARAEATFGPEIDALCPEAAREATELRMRMARPNVHATPTRPALRENLLLMAKHDQEARMFLHSWGPHIPPGSAAVERLREVDSANLKRLKHIISQDGFPTAEMVGLDGVAAAWLLTVHAAGDPEFQEKVLKLTQQHVRRGEVSAEQVAMLTDDILTGRGQPQRYGTNFIARDGELKPEPIEDEANVDQRRRAVGLISIASYACVLRAMYGSAKPQPPTSSTSSH